MLFVNIIGHVDLLASSRRRYGKGPEGGGGGGGLTGHPLHFLKKDKAII